MAKGAQRFWLFQANPLVFKLKEALRVDALTSFAVTSHQKKIQPGDKVALWQSGPSAGCYALGTVLSPPQPIPIDLPELAFFVEKPTDDFRVQVKVEYNLWNKPIGKEIASVDAGLQQLPVGHPGTNFAITKNQFKSLEHWAQRQDLAQEPTTDYEVSPRHNHPLNLILYGPPGTGKTFQSLNHALSILENRPLQELAIEDRQALKQRFESFIDQDRIAFVTFHQAFSYEDFVEGIKPQVGETGLTYQLVDGIFKSLCKKAAQAWVEDREKDLPPRPFVLVIDEINRGNVAAIFGDLVTLIESDKRAGGRESLKVQLPYSKTWFAVPSNIYIIGTMNSADQGAIALDLAFRRRFLFKALYPDTSLLTRLAKSPMIAGIDLRRMLAAINDRLESMLDIHHCIGQAYLMNITTLDELKGVFENAILPLLEVYFFGDYGKIGLILGKDFVQEKHLETGHFQDIYPTHLDRAERYALAPLEELQEAAFIRIYDKNYVE